MFYWIYFSVNSGVVYKRPYTTMSQSLFYWIYFSVALRRIWGGASSCRSLNPCFIGYISQSNKKFITLWKKNYVSILVLLDIFLSLIDECRKLLPSDSLNPCFIGYISQSTCSNNIWHLSYKEYCLNPCFIGYISQSAKFSTSLGNSSLFAQSPQPVPCIKIPQKRQ